MIRRESLSPVQLDQNPAYDQRQVTETLFQLEIVIWSIDQLKNCESELIYNLGSLEKPNSDQDNP